MTRKINFSFALILAFNVFFIQYLSAQANAGNDQTVCTDTTELDATFLEGATMYWSVIMGSGNFDSPGNPKTIVRNIAQGDNVFRWNAIEDGFVSYDDVVITNNSLTINAGDDQILPQGETQTILHGTIQPNGAVGRWDVVAGSGYFENPANYTTQVSDLSNGTNTFRWSVYYNECNNYAVVNVIADDGSCPLCMPEIITCTDTAQLNATFINGATQHWSVIQGAGEFDNLSDSETVVRSISYGTNIYRWTVTVGEYTVWGDVVVNCFPVTADAGSDILTCENETYIAASELNEGETGAWTIAFGGGNVLDPTSSVTLVSGYSATSYMNWTVSNEYCTDVDVMIITFCNSIDYQETSAGRLYPNPATHFVTLISESPINSAEIQVFNTLGQNIELKWEKSGGNTLTTDVQNIPAGTYFIKIKSESIKLIIK